ncbi:hypothetical protein [Nocardia sp. NBC_01388]|uniref:phage tail fiber protein n=1 Tax=Nocardia sp. NBC_01388 TaxID=2903596 RepID=UPI003244EC84
MAIAVTATKNAMCTTYSTQGNYISLHTADPGSTGANEATGGTPAYARVQTTWGTAASSQISGSQVTINVPAGTYAYAGIWTALTGGNFVDKVAISSTTLGSQSTLLITPTFSMT